ncbi:MAG: protein-L-isoaspartate(D-aspartate) O-methyltransferase [Candidatus Cloacimonetes bacterium HGW-Cloacimonetes-3]|jgi:protein-L-isoaspartate(D-aspartate) O-methyltransferase|nr:MAG: protein-L-isoaspartate(D-aspartate) O-methyltransferase [Candidatus Cloacimonetes bacterium HGW-Cloacimonetes-3]
MRYEDQRQVMVKELKLAGINDNAVLDAFLAVPREDYVLPEYRDYAYRNQPLPILHNQTISQPLMIAIMLQLLEIKKTDIVLDIGTGSGYQCALLAEIAGEVCSVERIEGLSLSAQKVLRQAGYRNIYFRIGDGNTGWQKAYPAHKSFQKIIVSAGAESIPERLVDQIAEGGIMLIPVGATSSQILHIIRRINSEIVITKSGACSFVPLVNEESMSR